MPHPTSSGPSATRVFISGSNRPPAPDARRVARADPAEVIRVSIYVRANPAGPSALPDPADTATELPRDRRPMSDADFDAAYGAAPADLDAVSAFARDHGLDVLDASVRTRRVLVAGTVAQIDAAFGTQLNEYDHPTQGRYRGREGRLTIPSDLGGVIEGVFGLDTRRVGQTRRCRGRVQIPLAPPSIAAAAAAAAPDAAAAAAPATAHAGPSAAHLPANSYLPPQIAGMYDFPAGDGAGQSVAIFAFNEPFQGGYNLAALRTYFQHVLGQPMPQITDVVVHGPGNNPGPDTPASERQGDATGEVMLDMQMVGSIVPAAKIVMYFTTFTTQGWVDAINAVIADDVHRPKVVSISYGNPEDDPQGAWTTMSIRQVNKAFRAAAARGITICCASGDDGSADQDEDGLAHADFPASSPYVLACGGTRVESADRKSIDSESVWNDSNDGNGAGGGGISRVFGRPAWQRHAGVPASVNPGHRIGRGVPDVAGIADPETPVVIIHVGGHRLEGIGGTSATAPLWAALVTRLNQALGAPVGFLNPLLYTRFASGVLKDIVDGDNGAYDAGPGWDACTGLGSPSGKALLAALQGNPVPQPHAVTAASPEVVARVQRLQGQLGIPAGGAADMATLLSAVQRLTRLLEQAAEDRQHA